MPQVAVVDDGVGTRVGERDADATEVASVLEGDVMVHRVAVLEEHFQIVGLRTILADLSVPPQYALAVHLRTPTLGATIVSKGSVGRLARRAVVDIVDIRKFIHLVAVVVIHPFYRGKRRRVEGDGAAAAVFVLHLAVEVRRSEFETSGIADTKTTLLRAFLGGDEYHAVAATRAIKCRCRGAFQDVEAFDILLVDVVEGSTPVATAAPVGDTAFVGHRHTVDNDKGLVVAKDAVVTTDGDTRRATVNAVGVDDLHTCRATAQGADDAARAGFGNQFAADFLGGIA